MARWREEREAVLDRVTANAIAGAHQEGRYRPVAVAFIRDAMGRWLFVESAKSPGEWNPVQGGIDPGEPCGVAVFREVGEEVGIPCDALTVDRLIGIGDLDAEPGRKDKRGFTHGKRYFCVVLSYDGAETLTVDPKEIRAYRWCKEAEIRPLLATSRPEKAAFTLRMLAEA